MSHVSKLEVAFDWITATWKHDNLLCADHIQACIAYEQVLLRNGHMQEVSSWQGYAGRKTGSFFVGERDDGYIIRVSGSLAHSAFTSIYRPDMHVSRLDAAVTAWCSPHLSELGLDALKSARFAKMAGEVKNPVTITHYEGDDGGFTLYLGKRSSKVYARLYNKEVESKDAYYEGAWRYECEMHNHTATETATELYYSLFPLEDGICSAVWRYFRAKGVKPVFDCFPSGIEIVLPRREETTIERSIRWLETQVKPTVAKLVALGYTNDVLAAIGLPTNGWGHWNETGG